MRLTALSLLLVSVLLLGCTRGPAATPTPTEVPTAVPTYEPTQQYVPSEAPTPTVYAASATPTVTEWPNGWNVTNTGATINPGSRKR